MLARLVICPLVALLLSNCGRHTSQSDEVPADTKQLFAVMHEAERTWDHLARDLASGRIWMAWRYSGERVQFYGQPMFESHRNPMLVWIWKTPIWVHLQLKPSEFEDVQRESTQVDSFTIAVLGRVEHINWYTKHVTIRSLQSYVDAGQ